MGRRARVRGVAAQQDMTIRCRLCIVVQRCATLCNAVSFQLVRQECRRHVGLAHAAEV